MKQFITFTILLCYVASYSQRYSSQPERTAYVDSIIRSIDLFEPEPTSLKSLPSYVDNTLHKFFPPIFNQKGNSCSQASGIRYLFSYEMNYIRDRAADNSQNIYSYHYTWNCLNYANNVGSWYFDGFDIIIDNGCPSDSDFPDESVSDKQWMNGYDKYFRSMHNGIEKYEKIDASASDGVEKIKRYLTDHGDNSEFGGLLVFSAKTTNMKLKSYTGSSDTGISSIITAWGNGGDHAMTFAGFDDKVAIDLNNNGAIDDDERGALIAVNSWGSNWGDKGKYYMPYKLLKLGEWSGGIGNGDKYVYLVRAKHKTPELTAKLTFNYSVRSELKVEVGISNDLDATYPRYRKKFRMFNEKAGGVPLLGRTNENMEIGLDMSSLLEKIEDKENVKYFVRIFRSGNEGSGTIKSFEVLDYSTSDEVQTFESKDKNIQLSTGTTTLSIKRSNITDIVNDKKEDLTISPNPVEESCLIGLTSLNNQLKTISLFDLSGRLIDNIFTGEIYDNNNKVNYTPPQSIPDGTYIMKIETHDRVYSEKLIIKR